MSRLQEAEEAATSLSGVKNVFLPLKLTGSLSNHVAHLVKTVEIKDQILSTIQCSQGASHKEIESLCS